jgi:hypothetical protein
MLIQNKKQRKDISAEYGTVVPKHATNMNKW